MRDLYDRGLIRTFAHQFPMVMVNIGLIVLTVILYIVIPKGFLPEQDTGIFIGVAQTREDTAFETIATIENKCAAIILKDPAVSGVVGFAGRDGRQPEREHRAHVRPAQAFNQRQSVQQVIARLRPALAKVVGVKFYMQSVPDIRIGARLEQAEYRYTLTDTSTDKLNRFAPMLLEKLQGMQVLTDVASGQQIHSPHVVVEVDRNLASSLNVPVASVDAALQNAFGQAQIGNIYLPTQQAYLILEARKEISIRTAGPVEQLRHEHIGRAGSSISRHPRHAQGRAAYRQPSGGVSRSYAIVQPCKGRVAERGRRRHHGGQSEPRRLAHPGRPVRGHGASVPDFAGHHAAPGHGRDPGNLHPHGHALGELHPSDHHSLRPPRGRRRRAAHLARQSYDLTLIALIGILLLIGIVKKNAIMMIDFVLAGEREQEMGPVDAVHQACPQRFRPIMMTTVCALIVALPLAVETGASAELRRPMGIAIVGGLIVSRGSRSI